MKSEKFINELLNRVEPLSDEEIDELMSYGKTQQEVADNTGFSRATIKRIYNRERDNYSIDIIGRVRTFLIDNRSK